MWRGKCSLERQQRANINKRAWRHLPVMVVYLQAQPLGSNNQSRLEMQVFGYHSVKFTKLLHIRDEIS